MSPWHPRWKEFIDKLNAVIGPSPEEDGIPHCGGHLTNGDGSVRAEAHAVAILNEMDMDTIKSIAFFNAHGAYCDCEIMLNVEEQAMYDAPTISRLNCNRCHHTWMPNSEKMPKTCPHCRSPYWNKKRKRVLR